MAIAVVQSVETQATSATTTIVLPSVNITAGNLVVIGCRTGNTATFSAVSPGSWTFRNSGGTGAQHMRFAEIANHPGGSGISYTVTASLSIANWWAVLWEISGCLISNPLDAQDTGDTAGTTPITSASFTTTQNNEIILTIAGLNASAGSGASWTVTPPTGAVIDFQPLVGAGPQAAFVAAHTIVSSVQTGVQSVATMTGGSGYGATTLGTIQLITYVGTASSGSGGTGGTPNSDPLSGLTQLHQLNTI